MTNKYGNYTLENRIGREKYWAQLVIFIILSILIQVVGSITVFAALVARVTPVVDYLWTGASKIMSIAVRSVLVTVLLTIMFMLAGCAEITREDVQDLDGYKIKAENREPTARYNLGVRTNQLQKQIEAKQTEVVKKAGK